MDGNDVAEVYPSHADGKAGCALDNLPLMGCGESIARPGTFENSNVLSRMGLRSPENNDKAPRQFIEAPYQDQNHAQQLHHFFKKKPDALLNGRQAKQMRDRLADEAAQRVHDHAAQQINTERPINVNEGEKAGTEEKKAPNTGA